MANRVLAFISKVYSYGLTEEIVEANPASRIVKNPKEGRERVLTDERDPQGVGGSRSRSGTRAGYLQALPADGPTS